MKDMNITAGESALMKMGAFTITCPTSRGPEQVWHWRARELRDYTVLPEMEVGVATLKLCGIDPFAVLEWEGKTGGRND